MKKDLISELVTELMKMAPLFYHKNASHAICEKYGSNLTRLQLITLVVISNNNGKTLKFLTDTLGVKKQQMSKLVDTLENENTVIRKTDSHNKRELNIFITQKGEELLHYTIENVFSSVYQRFGNLSEEKIIETIDHIKAISKIFDI